MITRTITRRNGDKFTVLLDEQDAAYYDQHTWRLVRGYAARNVYRAKGDNGTVYLHRELIKAPRTRQVDHINGNRLDNRRSNLRTCTQDQNMRNRNRNKDNTSGYVGVTQVANGRYAAQIQHNGRKLHIGVYEDARDAAVARDTAARLFHKDFARLNFPELVLAS